MNKKRQWRKSTSTAIYVPVAVLLIMFLAAFGTSAFLRIMYIEIVGASMYTEEEVINVAGISSAGNLLYIDIGAIKNSIYTNLPYINNVEIMRVLPDTILIEVTESTALAAIGYQNDILVIDSAGRVLERVDTVPPGLIEVRGFTPLDPEIGGVMKTELGGDEMRLQYLTEVLEAIEKAEIRSDVSYVDVASIVGITFGYMDRFTVVIGGSSNVQHKLSRLPQTIDRINEDFGLEETGRINMSDSYAEWSFYQDR